MDKKIFDIRQYLDDKRIYKSLKGHKIDFSFRPTAIDELYKEYTKLESEVAVASLGYNKIYTEFLKKTQDGLVTEESNKEFQKEVDKLQDLATKTRTLGMNLIVLAAQSNGQEDFNLKWMETELDAREFGYIIRFIAGTEEALEAKKK